MSATIDQKAYLQKYLGGTSKDKKKKKKKAIKGQGFKIIDDDIDLSKLRALEGDELDLFDEGEDAPQIAGIVDERPEEIKKLEQFKTTSKWKVINQDDGFNSKLQVEEIKQDIKEIEKENELIFGKMYSDSEDDKKDSDASPPRKTSNKNSESRNDDSSKREKDKHRSHRPEEKEQDASPPRKKNKNTKASKYDKTSLNRNRQSVSPPRKTSKRANDDDFSIKEKRHRSPDRKRDLDSDASPPRMPKYKNSKSNSDSPKKKRDKYTSSDRKRQDDSDVSPPRKYKEKSTKKHDSDSDFSPPRKRDRHISQSPIIKRQTVASPPRRDDKGKKRERKTRWGDFDDKHVNSQKSDSDQSPPRKILNDSKYDTYRKSKRNSDSDLSPKRRNNTNERSTEKYSRHKRSELLDGQSNSDLSPPRKPRHDENSRKRSTSPNYQSNRSLQKRSRNNSKSPKRDRNDKNKEMPSKMSKTLEGKMAGLQDAKQLREENEQFRRKENEVFNEMADEVSGRNAQVVSRKNKRETSEERQKHKEKAEKQKELDSKYQKWNRGLKQIEDQESRVKDFLHESSKPLARFKDDKDLEARLKDIERAGDPMLEYIRERKRDRGELPPEKPSYKGSFPPNRFNIRPGYRWDGVDRSNGYEKKYFEQQSKRKAQEEEAYKWSTEDL